MNWAVCLAFVVVVVTRVEGEGRIISKRADDADPLENIVMQHSAQLQTLQAQFTAKTQELQAKIDALSHHVAFLAQFSATLTGAIPNNSPYRFDQVVFNEGQGYDPVSGMFTAPLSGVYSFSLQIYLNGPQRSVVDIRLNDKPVSRMSLDTQALTAIHGEDSDCSTVILQLQSGDRVWVIGLSPVTYWGVYHTFFTGSLLHAN